MAFKLDGKTLAVGVPFTVGDINYPANWLRLSTADEKTALGITEVEDPDNYDQRFYYADGTAKSLTDTNVVDENGDPVLDLDGTQMVNIGVKSTLKAKEKVTAKSLLDIYDWQVIRKAEKGTELDSNVVTFRDAIRTAYTTRKTEIDNCADIAALVTLYDATYDSDGKFVKQNMTQYPEDPNN